MKNSASPNAQPNLWPTHIKHVALCGHPRSGKSTFGKLLAEEFGGVEVDDGLPLREAAIPLFGLNPEHPFTQDGKATRYEVCGQMVDVRSMLGDLGDYVEQKYGQSFMPERAIQTAYRDFPGAPFYIHGSVRKEQSLAYRSRGCLVIEVDNPNVRASGNAFDEWNKRYVDWRVVNDPRLMSIEDLRLWVRRIPELFGNKQTT